MIEVDYVTSRVQEELVRGSINKLDSEIKREIAKQNKRIDNFTMTTCASAIGLLVSGYNLVRGNGGILAIGVSIASLVGLKKSYDTYKEIQKDDKKIKILVKNKEEYKDKLPIEC